MKKSIWIIGAIVIIAVVGIYLYNPEPTPEPLTYDECVQQILKDVRKYKSASEESTGAKRTDNEGNVWTKQEDGSWKTNAQGFEGTGWGDALIDRQEGGAEYTPKSFPECEKYIFTRNTEMELGFTEILNEVIQEQSQKGVTISIREIKVLNLVRRVQGFVKLNCEEMNYEADRAIIESVANKFFEAYPNEFAEGSERDSWIDISGCSEMGTSPDGINWYSHTTTWRISYGSYGELI